MGSYPTTTPSYPTPSSPSSPSSPGIVYTTVGIATAVVAAKSDSRELLEKLAHGLPLLRLRGRRHDEPDMWCACTQDREGNSLPRSSLGRVCLFGTTIVPAESLL